MSDIKEIKYIHSDISKPKFNVLTSNVSNNSVTSIQRIQSSVGVDELQIDNVGDDEVNRSKISLLEKTGATIMSGALSLVEGVGQLGEALLDTGLVLTSAAVTPFAFMSDVIQGDGSFTSVDELWSGTKANVSNKFVTNFFDSFYDDTSFGGYLKDTSAFQEQVRSVGAGVGYTAGVVALTIFTLGLGGIAAGGAAAGSAAGSAVSGSSLAVTAGVAGIGKHTEDAWSDGAGTVSGLASGITGSAWEAVQWALGGKIGTLFQDGASACTKFLGSMARVALDGIDSGIEGFVQPLIELIYKNGYYDTNGSYVEFDDSTSLIEKYSNLFEENGGFGNVALQAAMGSGMSIIGEAGNLTKLLDGYNEETPWNNNLKVESNLKNLKDEILELVDDNLDYLNLPQDYSCVLEQMLRSEELFEADIDVIVNGMYKKYSSSEELSSSFIFKSDEYSSIIQALSEDYTLEEMSASLGISQDKIDGFKCILQGNNLTFDSVKAINRYSSGSNMILSAKRGGSREIISQGIDAKLDSRLSEYGFSQEQILQIHDYVNGLDYSKPLHENFQSTTGYLEQYGISRKHIATINSTVMYKNSLAHLDETLSSLDQCLTTKLSKSMKLTRAVKKDYLMSQLQNGEDLTSLIGRKIEETGYSSTSPIYDKSFAKYDDYEVVFDIYAPKGTQGISITPFSSYGTAEEEILLNSNDLYIIDVVPCVVDKNGRKKTFVKALVLSKDKTCYMGIGRKE